MGDVLGHRHDSSALMEIAAEHGESVSLRALELWRARGLLPRPVRQPGRRGVWLYPSGTDRQLVRLLYWRSRTRDLELIRLALWIEAFAIDLQGVRQTLLSFFDAWSDLVRREGPVGEGSQRAAAIDVLAAKMAAMRGRAAVPRVVRMTAAERTRAYGYMLALFFGPDEEVARRSDDAVLLERMVGLRSGRGGGLATAVPLSLDESQLIRFPLPSEVRDVLASASADEFELVRRTVQMMVVWTPLLLPLLTSELGPKATPFVEVVRSFFDDPPVALYPLLVTVLLVGLHARTPAESELHEHIEALDPTRVDAGLLLGLPAELRSKALAGLPDERRERLADAVEAAQGRDSPLR